MLICRNSERVHCQRKVGNSCYKLLLSSCESWKNSFVLAQGHNICKGKLGSCYQKF